MEPPEPTVLTSPIKRSDRSTHRTASASPSWSASTCVRTSLRTSSRRFYSWPIHIDDGIQEALRTLYDSSDQPADSSEASHAQYEQSTSPPTCPSTPYILVAHGHVAVVSSERGVSAPAALERYHAHATLERHAHPATTAFPHTQPTLAGMLRARCLTQGSHRAGRGPRRDALVVMRVPNRLRVWSGSIYGFICIRALRSQGWWTCACSWCRQGGENSPIPPCSPWICVWIRSFTCTNHARSTRITTRTRNTHRPEGLPGSRKHPTMDMATKTKPYPYLAPVLFFHGGAGY
ncbi:hypothetical protein C8J57DRAFT_1713105 [Mycena rebaudengoi]|nr:hypothetical protein C8J57DRAFT_1713105 [Mycena rebaudengoi]